MVVTIGGNAVNMRQDTIQIDDAIGERTTCSFLVQDLTGTANYIQSQPVEITEGAVTLFAGFIDNSTGKKVSGNVAIMHTINCKDMHYLADKRTVAKAYANTAAGDIVTALITDYLAAEGVTAGSIDTDLSDSGSGPATGGFFTVSIDFLASYIEFKSTLNTIIYDASITTLGYKLNGSDQLFADEGGYVNATGFRFYVPYWSGTLTWSATGIHSDPGIQAGPTVIEAVFNYISATKALESLAEKAGFIWYIDYDKKLYFMARETNVAPWTAKAEDMLDGTVSVDNGNSAYRNTQYVRGGKDITDTLTESRIGDGVLTAFTVGFPVAQVPTITLNAGAQDVGIRGIDTGKDWYWSKGSNVISQDTAGTILLATDTLAISYKGEFDVIVKTLNEAEITRLITAEASSGIVENVADENNSTTREAAFEVANSKLEKYGVVGRRLHFQTLRFGLFAGQILPVDLPEHDIDTDMLIETVSISTDQGIPFYDVVAAEGPEQQSWTKMFENMATRGTTFTVRENIAEEEVLITLATFTKTWLEATAVNIFAQPEIGDALLCGSFYPTFETDERVLYMELLDGADAVIIRKQITKQVGTTTLNSINYIAPFEAIGTIAKIAWYGGVSATAANGTGVKVDEQAYSKVKTSLEALQLQKTDTKGW